MKKQSCLLLSMLGVWAVRLVLDVEVSDVEGIVLDEFAARFYSFSH